MNYLISYRITLMTEPLIISASHILLFLTFNLVVILVGTMRHISLRYHFRNGTTNSVNILICGNFNRHF